MAGTILVLMLLVLLVAMVIRSMIKTKKAGKSLSCGGNCSMCSAACHANNVKKEK